MKKLQIYFKVFVLFSLIFFSGYALNAQTLHQTFASSAGDWSVGSGGSSTVSGGHINVTMADQGSSYRGDLTYNTSEDAGTYITLDPSVDIYFAIKFIGSRPDGTIKLEMKTTGGTWLNTQWNSGAGDGNYTTLEGNGIYYYTLTDDALWTGASIDIRKINIKLADNNDTEYVVDWIGTFTTTSQLEYYQNTDDDGTDDLDDAMLVEFSDGLANWEIATSGASGTITGGHLESDMGTGTRADLKFNNSSDVHKFFTLNPVYDKVLAIKFTDDYPDKTRKLEFKRIESDGTETWFNNGGARHSLSGPVYTSSGDRIYYLVLSNETNYTGTSDMHFFRFNFVFEDNNAGTTYGIDWLRTFASTDEMQDWVDDGNSDSDGTYTAFSAQRFTTSGGVGSYSINTSGASGTISSDNYYDVTMSSGRADIYYNYSSTYSNDFYFVPANDVYLALKFRGTRPDGNLKLEMQRPNGTWFNTKWNGGSTDGSYTDANGNYTYYFDLSKDTGYSSCDTVIIRKVHFVVADASVSTAYQLDWIGAFTTLAEVETGLATQFSGTANWSSTSNWSDGIPATDMDAEITSGTVSVDVHDTLTDLTISSGAVVNVNAGKILTVSSTLTNNAGTGGLILQSTASGTAMLNNNSSGVQATVKQFLPKDKWHYVGLPFTNSYKVEDIYGGLWVSKSDESLAAASSTAGWVTLTAGDDILPGVGYALYQATNDTTISVEGTLNTGSVNPTLAHSNEGWNLICNPYPISIDWTTASTTNVNNAIYLYDASAGTYGSYVNGTGANGQTQHIPPMQAFFIQSNAGSPVLGFSNSSKTTQAVDFKSASVNSTIRLSVSDNNDRTDETVLVEKASTTASFDNAMDAYKLIASASKAPQIYTESDIKYSINALPSFDESTMIPLRILAKEDGEHKISVNLENVNAQMPVLLLDAENNLLADLTTDDYQLELTADEEAFYTVAFSYNALKAEKLALQNVKLKVENRMIRATGLDANSRVDVYSLAGQKVASLVANDDSAEIEMSQLGVFVVKVRSMKSESFTGKVVIK